ncbi:MAG: TonB family protein [Alphaproteobacteria bacterium]|jgi:TonB family protein
MHRRSFLAWLFVPFCVATQLGSALAQSADIASLPRMALPVAPESYPVEAMIATEEGSVVLRATIGMDGQMSNAHVESSSGHARLDEVSVALANESRLSTPPTNAAGEPVSVDVLIDVNWELPLESAEEFFPNGLNDAAQVLPGDLVSPPSLLGTSNQVRARDYPAFSLRSNEKGANGVFVLVDEMGTIRDVRLAAKSGHQRLDEAVVELARRYKLDPGTISGTPAPMWIAQPVKWIIRSLSVGEQCYSMPLITDFERSSTGPNERVNSWTLVSEDGSILEMLYLTNQGWMRAKRPLLETFNTEPAYPSASEQNRPDRCWLTTSGLQIMAASQ